MRRQTRAEKELRRELRAELRARTGSIPFFMQFEWKMSANEDETMQRLEERLSLQ